MSLAPVNDAFKRLSDEGFVEVLPRTGYRITPVTLSEVRALDAYLLGVQPSARTVRGCPRGAASGHAWRVPW